MRILALDLGADRRGGQRQTLLLSAALSERGHDVTLVARMGSPLADEAAASGSPFALVKARRGPETAPPVLVDVVRAARKARPQVLWANDSRSHGAVVWSRLSRQVPLVVHRRVVRPPGRNPLSRLKYAAADRFLAISGAVVDSLVGAGVSRSRIGIVPDAVPESAFVMHSTSPGPPYRLVHVGAFDGKKGQLIAVEVLHALTRADRDVTLTFLGEGPERAAVTRRGEELGVAQRMSFEGDVPGSRVTEVLASSHVFVLPTETEASSVALLEAMAAGCPAVAHDTGGVAETLGTNGILVRSLDVPAWTEAMKRLLDAPGERVRLAEAACGAARAHALSHVVKTLEEELGRIAR